MTKSSQVTDIRWWTN